MKFPYPENFKDQIAKFYDEWETDIQADFDDHAVYDFLYKTMISALRKNVAAAINQLFDGLIIELIPAPLGESPVTGLMVSLSPPELEEIEEHEYVYEMNVDLLALAEELALDDAHSWEGKSDTIEDRRRLVAEQLRRIANTLDTAQ